MKIHPISAAVCAALLALAAVPKAKGVDPAN